MRVDLFSTVHKGVRTILFDIAGKAARADVTSTAAIDALANEVERALEYLDEHARIEETYIVPVLRSLDPDLAERLTTAHRGLEAVEVEVERAMHALEEAQLAARADAGGALIRVLNQLVAVQLIHMNQEETEINRALWAGMQDTDLGALRTRMALYLAPERRTAWREVLEASLNPVERRLVLGAPVG